MASAKSKLKYNYGSLVLGTYLGSAVAFGLGSAVHYGLGERPSDSPFFWPLTHVILPIVLPAAGAAIFHRLGSRPKQTEKSTASTARKPNRPIYLPPTISVSSSSTEGKRLSFSLGSLYF
jgi:hypothetical protein